MHSYLRDFNPLIDLRIFSTSAWLPIAVLNARSNFSCEMRTAKILLASVRVSMLPSAIRVEAVLRTSSVVSRFSFMSGYPSSKFADPTFSTWNSYCKICNVSMPICQSFTILICVIKSSVKNISNGEPLIFLLPFFLLLKDLVVLLWLSVNIWYKQWLKE